ncbi:putative nucleotidyltransferase substrate binding domain-containing protein [Paraburkholderia sp. A1RI_3L]|uniref:DUF294 nucleotidyltransferase-like domain-containing protein n=1 Tax=Paraburkholderia TaxID=1822464 RepID=UPI003B7A7876
MPNAFNFAASPFDCLNEGERRLVRDNVDIAYYAENEAILEAGATPAYLFVVTKGCVTQYEGEEVVATYGPDDCFDGRALVAGKSGSRFVAIEEVLAYRLARQTVKDLIASNTGFGALLFSDIGRKLGVIAQRRSQEEMQSLLLARVDAAFIRPAHFVDAGADVVSVVRLFQEHNVSSVLVRDDTTALPRLGIFTRTSLQRAILDGTPLDRLPVGRMSEFTLVAVPVSSQIGDALTTMLRHRVHRLVVMRDNDVVGLLESLDVFSFLANHSFLLAEQIDMARDLDALAQAASSVTRMVSLLFRGGSRVELIARQVQEVNGRLFERAWKMIAPPDLVANSCLFVMGSEGRGEQLLKTDQDNALVLRDGYSPPADLNAIVARFSDALAAFGYPPCPGGIMLSRPDWCMPVSAFGRRIREWLIAPDAEGLMNLAIFFDARAVCGDAALLDPLRASLIEFALDSEVMLARFASATEAFGNTQGWWNRLLTLADADRGLDIKKEGIFPIVHGVRSLALAYRVTRETGTVQRLDALIAHDAVSADMASELTESLHFLMGLRLKAGLTEIDAHRPVSGEVQVGHLSSLERDLLKDALGVVKRFRTLLRQRFRTEFL